MSAATPSNALMFLRTASVAKPDGYVRLVIEIEIVGSSRHHLRYSRTFPGDQKPVLIFEALQAPSAPRHSADEPAGKKEDSSANWVAREKFSLRPASQTPAMEAF